MEEGDEKHERGSIPATKAALCHAALHLQSTAAADSASTSTSTSALAAADTAVLASPEITLALVS